ncbi:MAG: methyl-accepting chemotaxis protein [Myxococcota bacterium]
MTTPVSASVDRAPRSRGARRRLGVVLAGLALAAVDLAPSIGILRAVGCFVGAALVAGVALRLVASNRRIDEGRREAIAVFAVGSASLLAAPAWVAAIEPGAGLTAMPWRSILVAAVLWPALAGLFAAQGFAIQLGRRALERARLDAAAALERQQQETAIALEPLERRIEAIGRVLVSLGHEHDRQAGELGHAIDAARALAPAAVAGIGSAGELAERVERCHRNAQVLRTAGEGAIDREDGLAHRIDAAARGLVALDHASRAMAERRARMAGASRESTTSLAELAEAVRSADGAAVAIHELSGTLVARAEQGRARFEETVAGMEAIRSATQSAEAIIRGLDARTREIGGILDVIDEVGDQTSLLALNAAIIAAQAGEHGRAFSVVAEEIRDLADRVLVGTKEIGGLIQSVQSESERAIGAIEAGALSVRTGVALAGEVGHTLDELTRTAHATTSRIAAVVGSVESQSRVLERAIGLAHRVEEAIRELETADVDRGRHHAAVAETMLGLRDAAASLRTLIQDQTSGFARIDGELGGVLGAARGLVATLESQSSAGEGVFRQLEAVSERGRSIGSIAAELAAAHEAIRFETGALQARSARTDFTSNRSSDPARARGEGS